MSRQESQKKGSRSERQKLMRAREGYEPLPPSEQAAELLLITSERPLVIVIYR